MGNRYVVEEEDQGMDAAAWIILIALILASLVFIGIPFLIGYIIYLIVKRQKNLKALAPTRCPRCQKLNALEFFKTEVIGERPVVVSAINYKQGNQANKSGYDHGIHTSQL